MAIVSKPMLYSFTYLILLSIFTNIKVCRCAYFTRLQYLLGVSCYCYNGIVGNFVFTDREVAFLNSQLLVDKLLGLARPLA